ncbi:class I SAM-dependent methyltransferase [Pseudoxanthomonas sp.]|uniref:class I SAM-dependent methyltransferase n=1 Tax=Pseudoxanthomonas sp. TaxID=1871049 RepID=UPI003F7E1DCC
MKPHSICLAVLLALGAPALAQAQDAATVATDAAASLDKVIKGDWRTPANVARDGYRHPAETLSFFRLQPDQTVVEITPGGGWYSEILAPYLRGHGQYVAAIVDPAAVAQGSGRDYQQRSKDGLEKKFAASPALYDKTRVVAYSPSAPVFGAPASADLVLTFRNVHNWRSAGQAEGMFKGFFDVLKSGGVLGVVEHRAKRDVPADDNSGYVGEAQVIALAEAAGFRLDGKSEINANPRDTKDHPNGVWTLPPSNNHDPKDAEKYKAIGESDRMTLRFVKP